MHESFFRGYQHLLYALPNGDTTTDRQYAREQWELYNLQRNCVRCNTSKKLKYVVK